MRLGDGDGLRWGGQLPVLIGLVRMREEELMCVCRACACGLDVGLCVVCKLRLYVYTEKINPNRETNARIAMS